MTVPALHAVLQQTSKKMLTILISWHVMVNFADVTNTLNC
jgi:hypothetical protein